jgi:heme/copper-type cytochrome/quinol oxidase subunit 2
MALQRRRDTFWYLSGWMIVLIVFTAFSGISQPGSPAEPLITIEARQFAYQPGEIRVRQGDRVTLRLVSTDVVHGLYLEGYDLSLQAEPGKTATLTFVADKPGSFRFRCNVSCGSMHPFMIGKLTVGANEWLYRFIFLLVAVFIPVVVSSARQKTQSLEPSV